MAGTFPEYPNSSDATGGYLDASVSQQSMGSFDNGSNHTTYSSNNGYSDYNANFNSVQNTLPVSNTTYGLTGTTDVGEGNSSMFNHDNTVSPRSFNSSSNTFGHYGSGSPVTYDNNYTNISNNYSNSSSRISDFNTSSYSSNSNSTYVDSASTNYNDANDNCDNKTNSNYGNSGSGNYDNNSYGSNSYDNSYDSGGFYDTIQGNYRYDYYNSYDSYNSLSYNNNNYNSGCYDKSSYGSSYCNSLYKDSNLEGVDYYLYDYNSGCSRNHPQDNRKTQYDQSSSHNYLNYQSGSNSKNFWPTRSNRYNYLSSRRGMRGTRGRWNDSIQNRGQRGNVGDNRGRGFRGRGNYGGNQEGREMFSTDRGGRGVNRMIGGNRGRGSHLEPRGRGYLANRREPGGTRARRNGSRYGNQGEQRYHSDKSHTKDISTGLDCSRSTQNSAESEDGNALMTPAASSFSNKRKSPPLPENSIFPPEKSVKIEENSSIEKDNDEKVFCCEREVTQKQGKIKTSKMDVELDPSVEEKLALLIEPMMCKLCSLSMNNSLQAEQHYNGKNHAKKVRLYRQSAALEVTLKKLEKEGSIVSGKTVVLMDENEEEAEKKTEERTGKDKYLKLEEEKESLANAPSETYCPVCDVSFNSPKQATQHYEGKNHHKKVRLCSKTKDISDSQKDHVSMDGSVFECTLCNVHVTCQEQLNSHLEGAKHSARLKSLERSNCRTGGRSFGRGGFDYRRRGRGGGPPWCSHQSNVQNSQGLKRGYPFPNENSNEGYLQPKYQSHHDFSNYRTPSGRFYCKVCNVTMSSDEQFAQHIESKKHKMNKTNFKHGSDEQEVS